MTQKIMMVVEQPRPIVMQTTEFVRGGGSSDYDALINKPAINGVTLEGDKTASELALATPSDVAAKYTKPSGGIPKTDLASAVQTSLNKADTALQTAPVTSVNGQTGVVVLTASDVGAGTYSKPSGGIPKTDLASAVQTSLGKADAAYQKPSGGIPATDLAAGVIPDLSGYATEQWVENQGYLKQHQSLDNYQTKAIADAGGYYTTDTVEGALQEIGAELAGINTLIGSGVIA